jgi:mannose-6-phosphate isomerase-like protein (cupin superfamily)
MHEITVVAKAWGEERIVVNESTHCGKILTINTGWQCSLHHHNEKDETFYVLSGPVFMQINDRVFTAGFGEAFRVPPGTKHRFGAKYHMAMLAEFSSHHDDADVVRFEDSQPIADELIARAED